MNNFYNLLRQMLNVRDTTLNWIRWNLSAVYEEKKAQKFSASTYNWEVQCGFAWLLFETQSNCEASSSLVVKSREAWRIWIKVLPLSKTRNWPWNSQKTYIKVSNRQTSSNIVTMNILTTERLACVYSPWNIRKLV